MLESAIILCTLTNLIRRHGKRKTRQKYGSPCRNLKQSSQSCWPLDSLDILEETLVTLCSCFTTIQTRLSKAPLVSMLAWAGRLTKLDFRRYCFVLESAVTLFARDAWRHYTYQKTVNRLKKIGSNRTELLPENFCLKPI